jgi:hypothetical protein
VEVLDSGRKDFYSGLQINVMKHKNIDQVAGLELAKLLILCRQQAYRIHRKCTAVFFHGNDRFEVA